MLYYYAAIYSLKRPVSLQIRFPRRTPQNVDELSDFCIKHNILDLYIWLSQHFPKYFIEREQCIEQKEYAVSIIQNALSDELKQDYSLANKFLSRRKNIPQCPENIPLLLPNNIREPMKNFLCNYSPEEWLCFPNKDIGNLREQRNQSSKLLEINIDNNSI